MTNSNDFRQYSYQYDTNRLISSFNYTRGSQATKVRPEYDNEKRSTLRIKKAKGIKNHAQLVHEEKVCRKKIIRIAAAAAVLLVMVAFVLNSFAVKNQLTRNIAAQETKIANAQSENISLQSKLNVMYSVSEVDKYASDKLKMSKVRQGQIQYIDVDEYIASVKNKKKSNKSGLTPAQAAVAAAKEPVKEQKSEDKKTEDENTAENSSEDTADENDSDTGERSDESSADNEESAQYESSDGGESYDGE